MAKSLPELEAYREQLSDALAELRDKMRFGDCILLVKNEDGVHCLFKGEPPDIYNLLTGAMNHLFAPRVANTLEETQQQKLDG